MRKPDALAAWVRRRDPPRIPPQSGAGRTVWARSMGKRSSNKRKAKDLYRTPADAVLPLLPFLPMPCRYAEPCAANGKLIDALALHDVRAHWVSDLVPGRGDVQQADACELNLTDRPGRPISHIITNPPWTRPILHPMIVRFSDQRPAWLLFDADSVHTKQAAPYMPRLRKVVSVGRLRWFPDSTHTGKDNCAWHLFDKPSDKPTEFFGRAA